MLSEPRCRLRYSVEGDEAGIREVALIAGTTARPRSAEGLIAALAFENDTLSTDGQTMGTASDAGTEGTTDGPAIGGTYRLVLTAFRPLTIQSCEVTFDHTFTDAERIFMNGYQSWTDSCEFTTDARMRGLNLAPRIVIDRNVLDGSGDYRFTNYPDRPGELHGYGYLYIRENPARHGDRFTLVGSLSEDSGFTLLRTSRKNGTVSISKEHTYQTLEANTTLTLCSFAVLEGGKKDVFDRWFQLQDVCRRPAKPLIGYTSWYRHYAAIDSPTIESDLIATSKTLGKLFDGSDDLHADDYAIAFQIDDGYTKIGDWLAPDTTKFPDGMAPLAARIASTPVGNSGVNLIPGLWLAPFVCEKDSDIFAEQPSWILHDDDGQRVAVGCNWSGAYALDSRNPEVRDYLKEVLGTVTEKWGFKLLKLDFLFAACILPHNDFNRGELMADAMELLRSSVPADTRFLCCGVPLNSVFGRTEYCRVGCDVGPDWDDKPYMRLLHRERVSTKNNRSNTISRAPLNGRAFLNDPDVFYLRKDVKLDQRQRAEQLAVDARCGGVLLTSDDMSLWDEDDMKRYAEALKELAAKH